jgi:hypothetical protein
VSSIHIGATHIIIKLLSKTRAYNIALTFLSKKIVFKYFSLSYFTCGVTTLHIICFMYFVWAQYNYRDTSILSVVPLYHSYDNMYLIRNFKSVLCTFFHREIYHLSQNMFLYLLLSNINSPDIQIKLILLLPHVQHFILNTINGNISYLAGFSGIIAFICGQVMYRSYAIDKSFPIIFAAPFVYDFIYIIGKTLNINVSNIIPKNVAHIVHLSGLVSGLIYEITKKLI